jgi:gluconate 2-dehydrogenase gamma chain
MTWVSALVDAIIPRSDTPGACDAGVPAFIDRGLANTQGTDTFRAAMAALDAVSRELYGATFSDLSEGERLRLLFDVVEDADSPAAEFVLAVKRYTVVAYYTSREGLCKELGWRAPSVRRTISGCTHPEHGG